MGLTALPAPEQWFQVLGISVHATATEIREAAQRLAFKQHPDRHGGNADIGRITAARDEGLSRLRGI
jgi:curved DNA-binding protein CbpA